MIRRDTVPLFMEGDTVRINEPYGVLDGKIGVVRQLLYLKQTRACVIQLKEGGDCTLEESQLRLVFDATRKT